MFGFQAVSGAVATAVANLYLLGGPEQRSSREIHLKKQNETENKAIRIRKLRP
jgi:hypothetical protein